MKKTFWILLAIVALLWLGLIGYTIFLGSQANIVGGAGWETFRMYLSIQLQTVYGWIVQIVTLLALVYGITALCKRKSANTASNKN